MKTNLTDVTFLILVRIDSIQRLENTIVVVKAICQHFNTTVNVRESSAYNNKVLFSMLKNKIKYEYIEDKDPVLHKTKHYNEMISNVLTPYFSIWDADVIPYKRAIIQCLDYLRSKEVDASYPYNGYCYNVPEVIREIFLAKRDIRILNRHQNKMNLLHNQVLYGGAVFLNKQKYVLMGLENEMHYGWGNEDFDRYYRIVGLGMKVFRSEVPLFHLSHPRNLNSEFACNANMLNSKKIIYTIQSSSSIEIQNMINEQNGIND